MQSNLHASNPAGLVFPPLLTDHRLGDFDSLTRMTASNEVSGFEWLSTLWIPMFQLNDQPITEG